MKAARRVLTSLAGLLALATLVLVAMACSDDARPSPPTIVASGPPPGVPTPVVVPPTFTPPAGTTPIDYSTVPVRWLPVADVPLTGLAEVAVPFPEIRKQTSGKATWQVYVMGADGVSKQVFDSPRWLDGLAWEPNDVLSASFLTQRRLVVPSSNTDGPLTWRGHYHIDLASGRQSETYESFPSDMSLSIDQAVSVQSQPDGSRLLVTVSSGTPLRNPSSYELKDVLLVDQAGHARRLEGVSGLRGISWVPNGKALVGFSGSVGVTRLTLLPASDGIAYVVDPVDAVAVEGSSADITGHRVALLVSDKSQLSLPTRVGIYDANSGSLQTVGTSTVFAQGGLVWPVAGDTILLGNVELFDVTTGKGRPGTFVDFLSAPVVAESVSANGRFATRFEEPQKYAVTPECAGLPFRLTLEDRQAGSNRVILECGSGTSGWVDWLSNAQLVFGVNACWACESDVHAIYVYDTVKGVVRPLTMGLEAGAFAAPSPSGDRIAVGGASLRLFAADGTMLLDLGPQPPGTAFGAVAWSPDGSKLAYIVRPAGWSFGP